MQSRASPQSSPPSPTRRVWSPGDGLPGYRVIRPLRSRGLPGELLAVREGSAGFRRYCTLRFARSEDPRCCSALAREAAILARLHHPAILPAYDLLQVEGWMALVLAFEGDVTLEDLTEQTHQAVDGLDAQSMLFAAHSIFEALAHAHGKGDSQGRPLVHGDMHPANVVVCSSGHVRLRGFRGTEPMLGVRPDLDPRTEPCPFAAPELTRGEPASTASDLYGAAALVTGLLAGPSFSRDAVRSLTRIRPDLPPEVAAAFDACLSPNPRDRRLRASTVAATLRKAVDLQQARDCVERLHGHATKLAATPPPPSVRMPRVDQPTRDTLVESLADRARHAQPTLRDPSDDAPGVSVAPDSRPLRQPARQSAVAAPSSLAPVAASLGAGKPPKSTARLSARQTALLVLALCLAPVSWLVGRHVIGPSWSSEQESALRVPSARTGALAWRSRLPSPRQVTAVSATSPPGSSPPPVRPAPSASAPVAFHQSLVIVEGPPDGIVFVNGVPAGPTGERLVTRGCGLRFVRVGTDPGTGNGSRFRWLNKGQTARLPCGGFSVIRAVTR